MDQDARRLLIRRKLADGSLPYDRIPRVWSGPGNGECCDACEVAITRQELLVEGITREEGGHGILFHAECFHAWETERRPSGRWLDSELGSFLSRSLMIFRLASKGALRRWRRAQQA
jgi:hypothetical protein